MKSDIDVNFGFVFFYGISHFSLKNLLKGDLKLSLDLILKKPIQHFTFRPSHKTLNDKKY